MKAVIENIVLPQLGEGIDTAKIACWHVSVGDRVAVDTDVVEVVTDKAIFNVSADSSGVVTDIRAGEGQDVKIGEVLAIIEVAE